MRLYVMREWSAIRGNQTSSYLVHTRTHYCTTLPVPTVRSIGIPVYTVYTVRTYVRTQCKAIRIVCCMIRYIPVGTVYKVFYRVRTVLSFCQVRFEKYDDTQPGK